MSSGSMSGANQSLKSNRALRRKPSLFKGENKKRFLEPVDENLSGKELSEKDENIPQRRKNSTLIRRTPFLKRLWDLLK